MPKLEALQNSDILIRHWPATETKAVLLLVHGMGAHSERWDSLANHLAQRGFPSFAIELRGFGETKDRPQGHIASFDQYYQDLHNLYSYIKRMHSSKNIFIFGESMGGLIAFNFTAKHPGLFAGLVLISPAFKNIMRFSIKNYLFVFSSLLYKPKNTIIMPFSSAMCTRDAAYQDKMNNDCREIRAASAKLLLEILFAQFQAKRLARKLRTPTLFLLAGKDLLIDQEESKRVFNQIKLSDKKLIQYPEMFHALSIDLGRERVFEDILPWLSERS